MVLLPLFTASAATTSGKKSITVSEYVNLLAKEHSKNRFVPKNAAKMAKDKIYTSVAAAMQKDGINLLTPEIANEPLTRLQMIDLTYTFISGKADGSTIEKKYFLKEFGVIDKDDIGLIKSFEGSVVFERARTKQSVKVTGTESVLFRDVAETDEESRLELEFDDKSVLTLGEDTSLVINEMIFDPAKQTRKTIVEVAYGNIRVKASKLESKNTDFEVKTPTAVIGVRGTEFVVSVGKDGKTKVLTLEGLVGVKSSNPAMARKGEVMVGGEQVTTVNTSAAPEKAAKAPKEEVAKAVKNTTVQKPIKVTGGGTVTAEDAKAVVSNKGLVVAAEQSSKEKAKDSDDEDSKKADKGDEDSDSDKKKADKKDDEDSDSRSASKDKGKSDDKSDSKDKSDKSASNDRKDSGDSKKESKKDKRYDVAQKDDKRDSKKDESKKDQVSRTNETKKNRDSKDQDVADNRGDDSDRDTSRDDSGSDSSRDGSGSDSGTSSGGSAGDGSSSGITADVDLLNKEIIKVIAEPGDNNIRKDLWSSIDEADKADDIRDRDAILTKAADAKAGRVLKDANGDRVRAQQYVVRPDSKTVQVVNVNSRSGSGGSADLTVMDWKTAFNDDVPTGKGIFDMPWGDYLNASEGAISNDSQYELDTMSVKFSHNDDSITETRGFDGISKSSQNINSEELTINGNSYTLSSKGTGTYSRGNNTGSGFSYNIIDGRNTSTINVALYVIGDGDTGKTGGDVGEISDVWMGLGVNTKGDSKDGISIGKENNLEFRFSNGTNSSLLGAPVDLIYIPLSNMAWAD